MTTNNTNASVNTTNATVNAANKKGATTMANTENKVTFIVSYGRVIVDASSQEDIMATFGLHKISFEDATREENKDSWKAVKSMVLKPDDKGGFGLGGLKGINTKVLYNEMCELFLNIGENEGLISKHDASITREENGLTAPEDKLKEARREEYKNKTGSNNKFKVSWESIRAMKNDDGSPMEMAQATQKWFQANIAPILEDIIESGKEAGNEAIDTLSKVELKARKDMYESFGKEDEKLVSILKGLHEAVANIKKYNSIAYSKISRLYSMNGIARASEIHKIISETISYSFAFVTDDEEFINQKMSEYLDAQKMVLGYIYKLRLFFRRTVKKAKDFLGVDIKGTLANRIYRILRGIFNITLYGTKVVIELGSIAVSGVASFAIFIGGKAYEGICWIINKIKTGVLKKDEKAEVDYAEDGGVKLIDTIMKPVTN